MRLDVEIRNTPGVATHESGTIIDMVASSPGLPLAVHIWGKKEGGVQSDHFCLEACLACGLHCWRDSSVGSVRWDREAEWDEVLQPVQAAVWFAAAWATRAAINEVMQLWVIAGIKRRIRQRMLDLAVWWRSAIYVMGGHLAGLTLVRKPHQVTRMSIGKLINQEHTGDGDVANVDKAEVEEEEAYYANNMRKRGTR